MSTRNLFVGGVVILLTISLCTLGFTQGSKILMTTGQQYQNMVPNASFESWDITNAKPSDWTKIQTPTLVQDGTVKRIGSNALKITSDIGSVSEGASFAITVEPRSTYTFSCYYYSDATHQAELEIDGNVTANLVDKIGASALASTSGTWKRYSVTFTTVTDTQVTIKLYAKPDSGAAKTAYFDGIILSEGHSVPAFLAHGITDTGNHIMYGNLTVEGTTNLNGDVNLGNLSTDNITITGILKSPTNANVAIQPQGTGIATISTNLTVTGTITADGLTLGQDENITLGAQTISHDGTDFQFSDGIDFGTNVLTDSHLGYFIGWEHGTDAAKMDGGDIYTGTVTSDGIAVDTIAAIDIATGAVESAEILDGTIAPADIGMIRGTAQGTANTSVAVAAGSVYTSGNVLINFSAANGDFGVAGNLEYTPSETGKFVKALVSLDSTGTLKATMGTEYVAANDAKIEALTYPVDELPIVEVILKTTGTIGGAIEDIEAIEGSLSYIYRDVRPFINVGGGSSTAATTFTIGSTTNETIADITLAFGNFGPETLTFDGNDTDNFVFSDIVDAEGYYVYGSQIATGDLADGANVAHINLTESITGAWSFDTVTTFNTDVNMTYAGTENLAITSAASSAVDAVTLDITSTNAGMVRGIVITQNLAGTEPVDVGLEIINADTGTAMGTAIKITDTGTITTGLDLGGTPIANSGDITGSGAMTVSSGSTSDLVLTGTYGVNVTATAQDIALSATTATNGGIKLSGPGAIVDVGVAFDGVIDVDATSITIDKADAGTLELRSVTTNYFAVSATEAITIGDSGTPTAMTINASTLDITPTNNVTVSLSATRTFDVNDDLAQTIISLDNDTRTLLAQNLTVNGTFTTLETTVINVEHWSINPGAVGTTAIAIEPVGVTLTGNLITAKKTPAGANVFVVDKDGNITTAGTYKGFTIGHSTHAQNTDTGTTGTGFAIASGTDAALSDVTLTFGGTNPETIIFSGATTDNFVFSDAVFATAFDAGSGGITNIGNISDNISIDIDLANSSDMTLAIKNSLAGVTNLTVDGSLTAASIVFDNSILNSETWTTSSSADITLSAADDIFLSPTGLNVLPGTDGTIDIGLGAVIETMAGVGEDTGTGDMTLTTSGTFTTFVDNDLTYVVKIDGGGNVGVGTYTWSRNNGSNWVATGVTTHSGTAELENGLSIAFGGTNGVVDDQWSVTITKNEGFKNVFANTVTTDKVYTPALQAENTGGMITLTGSLNVTGDLLVDGSQVVSGGVIETGQKIIRLDHAQAFLVEKAGADGSGTDIFFIDTIAQNAELYSALGIGMTPTSGVELDVLGDADFSGTLKAGTSDAFQVGANGTIYAAGGDFDIDVSGNITDVSAITSDGAISTSGNISTSGSGSITAANGLIATAGGLTVSGGGADVTGTVVVSSYIRSLSSIGLIPEYDNATPRGDGNDNFGTLSLEYDSINYHNYYSWTTDEPTTQDYDLVIRYRLPDGFDSFDATAPIKLFNMVSDVTGSTAVTVTMRDTANALVALAGGSGVKNTSWTESTITITEGSPTFAAGGYVTFTIKLFADQGDTVDVAEMTLKGNW